MTDSTKLFVVIDRDDGSRTFKGPWVHSHCKRTAHAWEQAFPGYKIRLVEATKQTRAEVRLFAKTTSPGVRYYPKEHNNE